MKCSIEGCPGECEEHLIAHTVRHNGQLIVIDHVPAQVCCECGDVLLSPDTIRRIEALLGTPAEPVGAAPLYEYA
ncbi:MAG TPA: YgiT-type zinc finger protein [bacterium]|nr:YgiT-type zinc finger protein [bacterium]